jgi:hypothetical protein
VSHALPAHIGQYLDTLRVRVAAARANLRRARRLRRAKAPSRVGPVAGRAARTRYAVRQPGRPVVSHAPHAPSASLEAER